MALKREIEKLGFSVSQNLIPQKTKACLFNSFNFDFFQLQQSRIPKCHYVHRVDGPIQSYRGWDNGTDRKILEVNQKIAQRTIFQSNWSLKKHEEMGFRFKNPTVISNASDPEVFNRMGKTPFHLGRKIRLISTSWSDNLNKGASVYKWLEENLDWSRFDYTFVGRSKIRFEKIQMIAPLPSVDLAALLRKNDIYITASRNDPCSNSLIEALSCGLPVLALNSGGHPELVGNGGLLFDVREEMPGLLERLVSEYQLRQTSITIRSMKEVAKKYLEVMNLA